MTVSKIPATPPRVFRLGEFHFSMLGPDCANEDFSAVTSSEAHLLGLFGSDWPKGMTWERNFSDLSRHAREFDEEVAFAWVIRNAAGGYLGCAYLNPEGKTRTHGKVYIWLQSNETNTERLSDLVARLKDWIAGFGYDLAQYKFVTP